MALSLAKLHVALDAAQQIDMAQNTPVMNTILESITGIHGYEQSLTDENLQFKDKGPDIIMWVLNLDAHQTKPSPTGTHYCCE